MYTYILRLYMKASSEGFLEACSGAELATVLGVSTHYMGEG